MLEKFIVSFSSPRDKHGCFVDLQQRSILPELSGSTAEWNCSALSSQFQSPSSRAHFILFCSRSLYSSSRYLVEYCESARILSSPCWLLKSCSWKRWGQ